MRATEMPSGRMVDGRTGTCTMLTMAELLDIPADLLNEFATRLESGETFTAAFVAAAVDSGCGRYNGLLHLADQIRSGREEVWLWFEGLLSPAAVATIRAGAEAGDVIGGLRRAAQVR